MAENYEETDEIVPRRGPIFLRAFLGAAGRVPMWFVTWLVPLLGAAVLALPYVEWFADASAHHYAPGALRAGLDADFRIDHATSQSALEAHTARSAVPLLFLMMLWGAFAAGGWLQVFLEKTQGHSMRRFFWGGARFFWRFLRVWILTLAFLAFVNWVFFDWPWKFGVQHLLLGLEGGKLETLTSERSALWHDWLQQGFQTLGFALVLCWADFTRTRLALQDARSALWAGLCTAFLFLRHPVRALRPFALLLALELAFLWGLGRLSRHWNAGLEHHSTLWRLMAIVLVGQLAFVLQAILRGARYHAALDVSRRLVPPSTHPDPWAKRIGGPGGPQYPIDDADEYGVSI